MLPGGIRIMVWSKTKVRKLFLTDLLPVSRERCGCTAKLGDMGQSRGAGVGKLGVDPV